MYYWVNLKAYEEQRSGGYLWAPSRDKNGETEPLYDIFKSVRAGDIIFGCRRSEIVTVIVARTDAYPSTQPSALAKGSAWSDVGFRVDCEYVECKSPIAVKNIATTLKPLLPEKYAPLDRRGEVNQGFFFRLTDAAGAFLTSITNAKPSADVATADVSIEDDEPDVPAAPETREHRVLGVHGIHACNRLLRILNDSPYSTGALVSRSADLSSRGVLRQPERWIPELIRFTVELGLASDNGDDLIAITPLGERYNAAGGDVDEVTAEQADLLRKHILRSPYASSTITAIVTLARLLASPWQDARALASALVSELGREGLSESTQRSWLNRTATYCQGLRISDGSSLSVIGRAFVAELDASATRMAPNPLADRGGLEPAKRRRYRIGTRARKGEGPSREVDREAWRQAQERRNDAHADLLDAVALRAEAAALQADCTQYADLMVSNAIIEVKSLEEDDLAQSRAALAQLYYYKFIHRDMFKEDPLLIAVFSRKPSHSSADLVGFLESCNVLVVWRESNSFACGAGSNRGEMAWLCTEKPETLERTA